MKNGDTRRGPRSFSTIAVSAMPVEAADAGADHHAGADLILVARGLPAGVVERLRGGAHREDDEIVDLALLLRLHPLVGIEGAVRAVAARNLAGDLGRQIGDVERLDAPCAAVARRSAAATSARRRKRAASPCRAL